MRRWRAAHGGNKKDLVLTSRLWQSPGRVAIYGWHREVDQPIQPLSTVHGARYADYSHGVRLVSGTVYVNGVKRPIADVLAEPALAKLLTSEGPLTRVAERLSALTARLAEERREPVSHLATDVESFSRRRSEQNCSRLAWAYHLPARSYSERSLSCSIENRGGSSRGCANPSPVSRARMARANGTSPHAPGRCRR